MVRVVARHPLYQSQMVMVDARQAETASHGGTVEARQAETASQGRGWVAQHADSCLHWAAWPSDGAMLIIRSLILKAIWFPLAMPLRLCWERSCAFPSHRDSTIVLQENRVLFRQPDRRIDGRPIAFYRSFCAGPSTRADALAQPSARGGADASAPPLLQSLPKLSLS